MADEHVGVGQLARADAVDEVVHMVGGGVAGLLRDDGPLTFGHRVELEPAVDDQQPAFGTA